MFLLSKTLSVGKTIGVQLQDVHGSVSLKSYRQGDAITQLVAQTCENGWPDLQDPGPSFHPIPLGFDSVWTD